MLFRSVFAMAFSPDGKLLASSSSGDNIVRLWDVQRKNTVQIFGTGGPICTLSFSNDGSYLKTEQEFLEISYRHRSVGQTQTEPPLCLFVKEQWVACRTENILRLPRDYRPTCSAVQDNVLVMGHASGRITFIEFDPAKMPFSATSK